MLLLPWRPRVLRSCDMEYVMLHLIFSLPHAWGGTTRNLPLPLVSQIFPLLPVSFENQRASLMIARAPFKGSEGTKGVTRGRAFGFDTRRYDDAVADNLVALLDYFAANDAREATERRRPGAAASTVPRHPGIPR